MKVVEHLLVCASTILGCNTAVSKTGKDPCLTQGSSHAVGGAEIIW